MISDNSPDIVDTFERPEEKTVVTPLFFYFFNLIIADRKCHPRITRLSTHRNVNCLFRCIVLLFVSSSHCKHTRHSTEIESQLNWVSSKVWSSLLCFCSYVFRIAFDDICSFSPKIAHGWKVIWALMDTFFKIWKHAEEKEARFVFSPLLIKFQICLVISCFSDCILNQTKPHEARKLVKSCLKLLFYCFH